IGCISPATCERVHLASSFRINAVLAIRLTASAASGTPDRNDAPAPTSMTGRTGLSARRTAARIFAGEDELGMEFIAPALLKAFSYIKHSPCSRPQNLV